MNISASKAREIFSSRLKAYRKEAGYKSARALAQELEIDENRYTRYERAEVEPNLQLIVQICGMLNTSPNELLGFDGADRSSGSSRPGFADGQQQAPFGDGRENDDIAAAMTPDAAYWHVAELVAEIARTAQPGGSSDLLHLSIASRVFKEIKADSFGYAAQIVNDPQIQAASDDERTALAERLGKAIALTVQTGS